MRRLFLCCMLMLLVDAVTHQPAEAGGYDRYPKYRLVDGVIYRQLEGSTNWEVIQIDREDIVIDRVLDQRRFLVHMYDILLLGHIDDGSRNFVLIGLSGLLEDRIDIFVFPNAALGPANHYMHGDFVIFPAVMNLDPVTGDPPSNGAGVYGIFYADRDTLLPIVESGLTVTRRWDGSYNLPRVMRYDFSYHRYGNKTVIAPIEGGYMYFEDGHLVRWTGRQFPVELVIPDESFADPDGLYLWDNVRLYRLGVKERVVDHATSPDGAYSAYLTIAEKTSQDYEYPVQRIYIIQHRPFRVVEQVVWGGSPYQPSFMVGNYLSYTYHRWLVGGDMAFAADCRTLLFTAYDQQTGASVWSMDVRTPRRNPKMLVGGLNYRRDGAQFTLPQLVDVDSSGFSLIIEGFRGIQARRYNYEGEMVSVAASPQDPAFFVRDGGLWVDDGTGAVALSGALSGQRYTDYKPSDGNGWGLAVGYIDDGTENFTLSLIEPHGDGFTQYTKHYLNSTLWTLPLSSPNGVFYDDLDNYLWIGRVGEHGSDTATVYFLEGRRDIPLITELVYRTGDERLYFPYLRNFTGEQFTILRVEAGGISEHYDIPTQGFIVPYSPPPAPRP